MPPHPGEAAREAAAAVTGQSRSALGRYHRQCPAPKPSPRVVGSSDREPSWRARTGGKHNGRSPTPSRVCSSSSTLVLRTGVRLVREIGRQAPLASFTTGEISPGPDCLSDSKIDAHIRATAITVHHPLGTCKMARAGDPTAVVDPELKVLGVQQMAVGVVCH
jgi:choline dehydrogenase-like flavoprotein